MPINIFPWRQTTCPFCFERFFMGHAPQRDLTSRIFEPDEKLRQHLEMPEGTSIEMPPLVTPRPSVPIQRDSVGNYCKSAGRALLQGLGRWSYWMLTFVWYPKVLEKQSRICPHCHMELPIALANGASNSKIIAIAGNRISGKSNFFGVLIPALEARYSAEINLSITPLRTFSTVNMQRVLSEDLFRERYGSLYAANPTVVPATRSARQNQDIRIPLIYRLAFRKRWWQTLTHPFRSFTSVDIVMFDAAGEDQTNVQTRELFGRYIRHASAIIALIDPLSMRSIRNNIGVGIENLPPIEGGIGLEQTTIGRIIGDFATGNDRKIPIPLAVTLTKFDMLRDVVGNDSCLLEDHLHQNGINLEAIKTASQATRDFLTQYQANNLVQNVTTHFQRSSFFAVSALGSNPVNNQISHLQPINIADPLFWVLYELGCLPANDESFANTMKKVYQYIRNRWNMLLAIVPLVLLATMVGIAFVYMSSKRGFELPLSGDRAVERRVPEIPKEPTKPPISSANKDEHKVPEVPILIEDSKHEVAILVEPVNLFPDNNAVDRKVITLKGIEYTFCWCPPGTFIMGNPSKSLPFYSVNDMPEKGRQHRVTLSQGFWMLQTEVTQEMWESVMGSNPSNFSATGSGSSQVTGVDMKNFPVESVSWYDCQKFIAKLNELLSESHPPTHVGGSQSPANDSQLTERATDVSRWVFSLPTEAQLEYAYRAGTKWPRLLTDEERNLVDQLYAHSLAKHRKVGWKVNAWGIYDMLNNVREWCLDWYGDYPSGEVTDPAGAKSGSYRVVRGSTGYDYLLFDHPLSNCCCGSAFRGDVAPDYRDPYIGLRLCLMPFVS